MGEEKKQTENVPGPAAGGAVATIKKPARGFEEPTVTEDLIIPRAKLLQALSPEVQDDKEGKFKQGMVINSLTKEVLPGEFIAIFKFTNWIRFNPRKKDDANFDPAFDPGAIIWRSNNPDDPKVKEEAAFGPGGERPKATKFMNFFAYFPGTVEPVIVSFSASSFKAGKKLISLATYKGGDMFEYKYKLIAKQTENELGKFYVLDVEPAGKVEAADFAIAEGMYTTFKPKAETIQVHMEDAKETPEEAASAPSAENQK